MLMRVANWHGEQAANYYQKWTRTEHEVDLRGYVYHIAKADKMWKLAK